MAGIIGIIGLVVLLFFTTSIASSGVVVDLVILISLVLVGLSLIKVASSSY